MAKAARSSEKVPKSRAALTPEAREKQLIALAIDVAEEQMRNGTASSQVISHFLKLGSTRAQIEKELLEKQRDLAAAKAEAIESSAKMEDLYLKAAKAKPKQMVEKTTEPGIIKTTVYGHSATPKQAAPNSIADHVRDDGKVDVRSFYDEDGWKAKDIHLSNHGNPKHHSFGEHGEHIDLYEWNEDGSVKRIERRELTDDERKENEDIL